MRRGRVKYYSAEELCELYPEKYIAVKVIEKDSVSLDILKCQLLKVYNTLDDCKQSANELRFFQKLYKEKFDVIYGNYDDYKRTRCVCVENIFDVFGFIAFELLGMKFVDPTTDELDEEK